LFHACISLHIFLMLLPYCVQQLHIGKLVQFLELFGSTFGNDLAPTSNGIEVIFSIINVLSGLMLFTLLIGNIQVKQCHFWSLRDCITPLHLQLTESAGVSARRPGKEEEDAAAVPGHGMVDETEAAAIPAEAKGPQIRARTLGRRHGR
jgi:hypothetical protein